MPKQREKMTEVHSCGSPPFSTCLGAVASFIISQGQKCHKKPFPLVYHQSHKEKSVKGGHRPQRLPLILFFVGYNAGGENGCPSVPLLPPVLHCPFRMKVIELFENTGITYWLDGGWGVDILAGKQTRIHRDIDINFDAQHTEKLLNVLLNLGYKIDTDWKPVRIELYSDELGYLDIHPFVLNEDGTSKQADLEGGWYEFEKDYFGSVFFEGKTIPCISLKGQKVFHSGYELRDKDKHDISILESLSK